MRLTELELARWDYTHVRRVRDIAAADYNGLREAVGAYLRGSGEAGPAGPVLPGHNEIWERVKKESPLDNRWSVHRGWSDAARAASLAVRRAKAAARDALKSAGDAVSEFLAGGIVAGKPNDAEPRKGVCYACGLSGHYAADCPDSASPAATSCRVSRNFLPDGVLRNCRSCF